jgi:hypothetical protein
MADCGMKSLLLLLLFPLSAHAAAFRYTSFSELAAPLFQEKLEKVRALKAKLEAALQPASQGVRSLKEDGLSYDAFQTLRDEYYVALSLAARWHRGNAEIKELADWGYNTWVALDPAIDLHSERLISQAYYDALRLK